MQPNVDSYCIWVVGTPGFAIPLSIFSCKSEMFYDIQSKEKLELHCDLVCDTFVAVLPFLRGSVCCSLLLGV